jgi:aminoglycoside phosphotransferase family enzyme
MKPADFQNLTENLLQTEGATSIRETHISQVILTPKYAYKIPKAIQLPYLDFSSLEQRKDYCDQEIKLNRRFTEGVYLAVVSIRNSDGQMVIGEGEGTLIDYAIKMKRLPEARLMSNMLKNKEVQSEQMIAIANQLVRFHRTADKVDEPPDIRQMQKDFADLLSAKAVVEELISPEAAEKLEEWVLAAQKILANHEVRILERHQQQFYIEIHGDLHASNIFLMDRPVFFDCIAFNNAFRQGDLLNELAFFCMDMDHYGRSDLGNVFLQHYLMQMHAIETEEDQLLFLYYKRYRANIRLKVNALKWQQTTDVEEKKKRGAAVVSYYALMERYFKGVN